MTPFSRPSHSSPSGNHHLPKRSSGPHRRSSEYSQPHPFDQQSHLWTASEQQHFGGLGFSRRQVCMYLIRSKLTFSLDDLYLLGGASSDRGSQAGDYDDDNNNILVPAPVTVLPPVPLPITPPAPAPAPAVVAPFAHPPLASPPISVPARVASLPLAIEITPLGVAAVTPTMQ
jgi:hypothetical protein